MKEPSEFLRRSFSRLWHTRQVDVSTKIESVEPPQTGVWSGAFLTYDTAHKLNEWAKEQVEPRIPTMLGTLVEPAEYHCTIVASRRPVSYSGHGIFDVPIVPDSEGYFLLDLLGAQVNRRYLVLRFDQALFTSWHNKALEDGATWDFPDYKPHNTIAHTLPDRFSYSMIPLYIGELAFRFEEVKS